MADKPVYRAFTTTFSGFSNKLLNDVIIVYAGKTLPVKALWDTGATNTCISQEVAKSLSMIPTGKRITKTAGGEREANTHLVDVILPNNVGIPNLPVSDSTIGDQGLGMLIGMDIICSGDFSVSNSNNHTVFTFRMPSKTTIDYVKEIERENLIPTHGKGKRKRR